MHCGVTPPTNTDKKRHEGTRLYEILANPNLKGTDEESENFVVFRLMEIGEKVGITART